MNRHEEWQKMHASKKEQIEDFKDRKFGMFIHFGLYSMLAGEWQGQRIEEGQQPHVAEWIMHAFKIKRDDYRQLAKNFNPTEFSAEFIADLAKKAGMKYVVLTSKHHEGFALYDSKINDFNSVKASPYGKDLVQQLKVACENIGLGFGLYYSHSIDWMHGGDGGVMAYKNSENRTLGLHAYNDWDHSEQNYDDYIGHKALVQVEELLVHVPELCNIWFDVAYYIPEKYSFEFYKLVHKYQPQALISQRIGNGFGDIDCPGDNVVPSELKAQGKPWETVGTMNNSWGFKHYDHDWKSSSETLLWLIDIVSKGGNYMLNIGPDGQGRVPEANVQILSDIGEWLSVNGEAVYGTRPWEFSHEGPTGLIAEGTEAREDIGGVVQATDKDYWFTAKENVVYAIALVANMDRKVLIRSINVDSIKQIDLLGDEQRLTYQHSLEGLEIVLPEVFNNKAGYVLKIVL